MSLKDVLCSEKIIKIKSLVQEGFDIDENIKVTNDEMTDDWKLFETSVQSVVNDANSIRLSDDLKEVSNHIAGYIAHKLVDFCEGCCKNLLTSDDSSAGGKYLQLISRGGLKVPSNGLSNYIAHGFAI